MTTTADTYKTAASQAREATEKSVEALKQGAKTVHRPGQRRREAADRRPDPAGRAATSSTCRSRST